jgi:hypothetical protein
MKASALSVGWYWLRATLRKRLASYAIIDVPEPTVPTIPLVVVGLAAMVLANVVAALPGRSAARTSTAQVLRGE